MTSEYAHIGFSKPAECIHQYINLKHYTVKILVTVHAWLLTEHFFLPANFLLKLAAKFIDLCPNVATIGPAIFFLL